MTFRTWTMMVGLLALAGCSGSGGGGTGGGTGGTGMGGGAGGGVATGGGSGTGGGTNTGGGTGGGMATGGGTGTGGGSGGGGGSPTVGTFLRVGLQEQLYAAAPDGSMHVVFNEGYAERIIYGHCSAGCSDPASWNLSQLLDHTDIAATTVGVSGLAVDTTGRVHALVGGVASAGGTDPVLYATCASNCGVATNWAAVDIGPLLGDGVVSVTSGLTVSANGTIGVIGRGSYGNRNAPYATCSTNCTDLANWTAGLVVDGTVLYLALDGAGVSHILFSAGTTADGDQLHYYGRCASNCTQASSWQLSTVGFVHTTGASTAGFTVTPSGRVFLAYNQGNAHLGTGNNNHVLLSSCLGAGCTDLTTWTSFTVSTDENEDEAWLAHSGEQLELVSTSTLELRARTCASSCQDAAGWSQPVVIDQFQLIAQAVPPDSGSSCAGSSTFSAWYPTYPRSAIGSKGTVIAHAPYALVTCPGSTGPARLANIGRVFSTF